MENEKITIRKPLYGTFCNINESVLKKAFTRGVKLEITIPQGMEIVDPKEWIKTGTRVEKVFLRPDEPMILWGNTVKIPVVGVSEKMKKYMTDKEREEDFIRRQQKLF